MPYNEHLADRIRQILSDKRAKVTEEKKMFGGLCFMVNNKMCIGVMKEDVMARVGRDAAETARTRLGARPMDFTKRPMKDFVFVDPEGTDMEEDLEYWVELCLAYNPLAKVSKKRQKKE